MTIFAAVLMTCVAWFAPFDATPEAKQDQRTGPIPVQAPSRVLSSHAAYEARLSQGEALATLLVTPKAPFKINLKYPWRFVGAKNSLGKDRFEQSEQRSALELPLDELPGELRFSVCDEHSCLLEKLRVDKLD